MANLKTDSPLCHRIARSFLHFLNSVEPSAGVDTEALDVAKDCLVEVFKIDQSSLDSQSNCDSLVDIFSASASSEYGATTAVDNEGVSASDASKSLGKDTEVLEDQDRKGEPHSNGKDELFGHFFGALEKIHYFRRMPDGNDDQIQLDRATYLFHNAVEEMQVAGCLTFDQKSLAEAFKSKGNKAMQSKLYTEAIEQYTFAIALCEDNAVYYCNRAAAYTQMHRYSEAVQDCLRSIEIKPNYSKAYSRLGFAYYAQGKYRDAIDKGFTKALQLDPNNDSVKENIRVAEQKLKEEQQRAGPGQSSTSTSRGGESRSNSAAAPPPPFTSMPFNINGITSMMMNMAGGQNFHDGPHEESENNEPEIRISGNMPEELSGAFRSMMGMFSGAASQPDDRNGRSSPS